MSTVKKPRKANALLGFLVEVTEFRTKSNSRAARITRQECQHFILTKVSFTFLNAAHHIVPSHKTKGEDKPLLLFYEY